MIVVKLIGGLGNQMFQYAFGRNLSVKFNTNLKLDISAYSDYQLHDFMLENFNISAEICGSSIFELPLINEKNFHSGSKFIDNAYYSGYWQSEKYFLDNANIIRSEFSIPHPSLDENKYFSELINITNSVSIHIRRGDYLPGTYDDQILDSLPLGYFYTAIEHVKNIIDRPVFFVFSDDIEWVKENFKINQNHFFVGHNSSKQSYEDIRLISMCKHNIISNSTFSWWGAWLNPNLNKIVISPKSWFNKNCKYLNTVDLIPKAWLKIEI